ncbi:hypothetical protein [Amycolatopsis cihanbeyliensis]|uniref:Uncharacterized protein n=1 Tax=Amycolatopsis cihanbeyliensis TaxID=1128664 RepID=A0A542DLI4_AMYCI|nr:hypothetical protein [Amycolatopsis cihanbeyliensis]TQJ03939.1 hypothetical protein FB471_3714 [Amycolatopsis cihanbeyliensis]
MKATPIRPLVDSDVVRLLITQRATRREAERAITALHGAIAASKPERIEPEHYTPLLQFEEYDFGTIQHAWDKHNTTLLPRDVYWLVLDLFDTDAATRDRIDQLYRRAAQAQEAIAELAQSIGDDQMLNRQRASYILARQPPRKLDAELRLIATEDAFMDHLRALKERGGKGVRSLAAEMRKVDADAARSSTTINDMLAKPVVPSGEKTVRLLIQVLLRSIHNDTSEALVDEYMGVWSRLIIQRTRKHQAHSWLTNALDRIAKAENDAIADNRHDYAYGLHMARTIVATALESAAQQEGLDHNGTLITSIPASDP